MKNVEAKADLSLSLDLGATYVGNGVTRFRVWAPSQPSLSLELERGDKIPMQKQERGYFSLEIEGVFPSDLYFYRFSNGLKRADPVSRSLPKGVHGPTQVIDPNAYTWKDQAWKGVDLANAIIYETHVGTFSKEGTFEGVIKKLDYLIDLGVTMIEIMPVAQFPGKWNWGYDGVSLYAPCYIYGGVEGLKRLVDCAHQKGMAVCLDVVYNHLGPEGNYLSEFGNYFSQRYQTPWGQTFNFDSAFADEVRHYILSNAHYWATEYHIDALRLDAIHGIFDFSAQQMLPALAKSLLIPLIAESALNDARHVRPNEVGGTNLAGVWDDDFHHAVHVALTHEDHGYYKDFNGFPDLAKTVSDGFAYNGRYSIQRKRTYGSEATGLPYKKFVVYNQNHDQIGNRAFGDRLIDLVGHKRAIYAAYLTLMSPFIPLLFMGEEYGEERPFEYFIDLSDESLMRTIHEGRKKEFYNDRMPFPGEEAFNNSKLSWKFDEEIYATYKKLIALRKQYAAKQGLLVGEALTYFGPEWIAWEYLTITGEWIGLFCSLGSESKLTLPFIHVRQEKILLGTQPFDLEKKIPSKVEIALLLI